MSDDDDVVELASVLPYLAAPAVEILRTLGGAATTTAVLDEHRSTLSRTGVFLAGLTLSGGAGALEDAATQARRRKR